MLDLETLRIIWWLLIGVLLAGFALTDGFDFGAAILLPFIARNETEKRIVLNCIGPVWEGNQVWIILGAGAILAAWPYVYAVAFSGFYFLILLLRLTMGISRPVSFKYRSKLPQLFWRQCWDHMVFIGGIVPAIIFGLLIGNVILGVPFYFDNSLRFFYTGSFFDLFSPFACWCGFTSLAMLIMHGGLYIAIKTDSSLRERALFWSRSMALVFIFLFALGGIWIAYKVHGYWVTSAINTQDFSNPLHKTVVTGVGAWLTNYQLYPITLSMPILGFVGAILVCITAYRWSRFAFCCSGLGIIGTIGTVGVSLFPFIIPSSADLSSSLLVWDTSSSQLTLFLMLIASIIFIPIILLYTAWVYRVLAGKVNQAVINKEEEKHTAY